MMKRALSHALSKPAQLREYKDIHDLQKYFVKFKYFKELVEEHG